MAAKVEEILRAFYFLFLVITNIFLFLIIPGWLTSTTFFASYNQWNNGYFGFGVLFLFLIAALSVTASFFLFLRHLKTPDEPPQILYSFSISITLAWICFHIIMMLIVNVTNETVNNPGYGVILFLLGYLCCTISFIISYFLLRLDSKKRKMKRKQLQQNFGPKVISSNILMFPNQQMSSTDKTNLIHIDAPELPSKIELPD